MFTQVQFSGRSLWLGCWSTRSPQRFSESRKLMRFLIPCDVRQERNIHNSKTEKWIFFIEHCTKLNQLSKSYAHKMINPVLQCTDPLHFSKQLTSHPFHRDRHPFHQNLPYLHLCLPCPPCRLLCPRTSPCPCLCLFPLRLLEPSESQTCP